MRIGIKDFVPNTRIITYMFDGFVALPPHNMGTPCAEAAVG